MEGLEERLGYYFHDREYLRRALTCQSAINERNSKASKENSRRLEFVGDAVLKYIITILVYNDSSLVEELHNRVRGYIENANLGNIGRNLQLERYIIRGRGVCDITENMLANAVEAILGAIVFDQRQHGYSPENILCDVIARIFSIESTTPLTVVQPPEKRWSCWQCLGIGLLVLGIILVLFISDRYEL